MTTTAGINLHVDPSEISHHYHPADNSVGMYGTLDFGRPGHSAHAHVFFEDTAEIDTAIAELVALKQEMAPPVITVAGSPVYHFACGCSDWCNCPGCQAGKRHEPGTMWYCDKHGQTAVAEPAQALVSTS